MKGKTMSVREKLIELLDEAYDICQRTLCSVCVHKSIEFDCSINLTADHLISNGVTVQKWIPVSEKLPAEEDADAQGRVYAISEGAYPRMWQWSMVIRYPECFTHWYKLPEPPKECE